MENVNKKFTSHDKLMRLVTSAVMIALGFVLSFFKFSDLPYGGSVTCFSMVPIVILGCTYGMKWGLVCGVISSLLQAMQGALLSKAFLGMGVFEVIAVSFLDYIAAFTVIGLAGMFVTEKVKAASGKKLVTAGALGALVVSVARYAIHFLSGAILYGSYAEWFFSEQFVNAFGNWILKSFSGVGLAVVYSAVYNGLYMIPEIIITVVGTAILFSVEPIRKRIVLSGKI